VGVLNGDKKSTWVSLNSSPLLFRIVSNLIQALVITYDQIFQALAVEGDVLLPKPFLDLGLLTASSHVIPGLGDVFLFFSLPNT
jgi:hypothetical protein